MPVHILRARLARASTFALHAIAASVILAACGGGSEPAGRMPAPADDTVQKRDTPFWENDSGVRPTVEQLLNNSPQTDTPVITLNGDEVQKVRQAASQAKAGAALPRATKAVSKVVHRRPVTGMESIVHHTASGSTSTQTDLSRFPVTVYAPDGNGGFEQIAASTRNADGTYVVAGVPEGGYWVTIGGTSFVWTTAPFVDWGYDASDRAGVQYPTTSPTGLTVQASGLAAWQADDNLHYVVPSQGWSLAVLPDTSAAVTNPPATGATALANFGLDFSAAGFPLLSAAAGDQAYVNQLARRSGDSHRSLVRSLTLPALNMSNGAVAAVNGSFQDVPASEGFPLQWQRSAYASLGAAVNPSATLAASALTVYAFDLPTQFGLPAGAFTLAEHDATGSSDIDFGTLRFGNPFPATWSRVLAAAVTFDVGYLAPGATVPLQVRRGLYSEELLESSNPPLQLSPRLSPVRTPKINGKNLFQNQLAVGTTPKLTWTRPEIGTPKQYFIRLSRLTKSGSATVAQTVATFNTTETNMTVPPGLMQPGETYFFSIAAVRSGNTAVGPRRLTLPYAFATTLGAIVSP